MGEKNDHKARYICKCGNEAVYPIINPTAREVDKWLNEGICKVCRKKFRPKKKIDLKKYFKKLQ